jgi:hypothetical protein
VKEIKMADNQAYITLYENILKNDEMLREMACDPESTQAVFDQIREVAGGRVPGTDFLKLLKKIGESIMIKSEVAGHFTDMELLTLYGSYFDKWFSLDNFREESSGFGNPIFGALQEGFTSCTKNNHIFSFEYLISNSNIEDYDVDALDLLIALKDKRTEILELIYMYANKETYGTKGALRHVLQPAIRNEFIRAHQWLNPEIIEKLDEFVILQEEAQDA